MSNHDLDVACLTVRLGALGANYREIRRLAGTAATAGVVKADAYGLGMAPVARALAGEGCDTFFVARAGEGIALRPVVPQARIFVLDGATADSVPALLSHRLTPVLNSLAEIAAWSAAAREMDTTLDAAIHVDTGMNRLGLPAYELATLAGEAKERLRALRPVLVMSHLACADDPASAMNALQRERFRTALAMLPAAPASLSSSGGVLLGRDYAFDMVRPGIGLYGGNPWNGGATPFAAVARLAGRVLQLRRVDLGESVGYGATHRIERQGMLATVALGYADGAMRALGNAGHAALGGVRAPIVGRVSMDLITLDVTDVPPRAREVGAEAEFFGDVISIDEIARAAGTAHYEILTRIGARVPRRHAGEAR
ncbi:MAG TPA: alanine racemase [Rhizomicrobium sp.]|nr:alanine racemase [Rhizomicrobium sp.]